MNVVAKVEERPSEPKGRENTEWMVLNESNGELLDFLGDEYTIEALTQIIDDSKSVSAVAERTSMSRTTAFRRLDRLAGLGLVDVTRESEEGQGVRRYKTYRSVVNRIAVTLTEDGFRIEIAQETSQDRNATNLLSSPAD